MAKARKPNQRAGWIYEEGRSSQNPPDRTARKIKNMIYELRTYQVVPGKMKNLNDRFANITVPLFEKHGMKVIGFWETAIGEATTTELIYMLAFEDLGHYQRAWDAFIADPAWQEAKRLTEVGGPLVNVASSKIIEPTDYSPLQ